LKHILQPSNRNALVVLPITIQEVDYKEDPLALLTAPGAFDGIWLALVIGALEVSLPIRELKYYLRISRNDEYFPVMVSVLGKPGDEIHIPCAQICY